jgi:hypothetical protein
MNFLSFLTQDFKGTNNLSKSSVTENWRGKCCLRRTCPAKEKTQCFAVSLNDPVA